MPALESHALHVLKHTLSQIVNDAVAVGQDSGAYPHQVPAEERHLHRVLPGCHPPGGRGGDLGAAALADLEDVPQREWFGPGPGRARERYLLLEMNDRLLWIPDVDRCKRQTIGIGPNGHRAGPVSGLCHFPQAASLRAQLDEHGNRHRLHSGADDLSCFLGAHPNGGAALRAPLASSAGECHVERHVGTTEVHLEDVCARLLEPPSHVDPSIQTPIPRIGVVGHDYEVVVHPRERLLHQLHRLLERESLLGREREKPLGLEVGVTRLQVDVGARIEAQLNGSARPALFTGALQLIRGMCRRSRGQEEGVLEGDPRYRYRQPRVRRVLLHDVLRAPSQPSESKPEAAARLTAESGPARLSGHRQQWRAALPPAAASLRNRSSPSLCLVPPQRPANRCRLCLHK